MRFFSIYSPLQVVPRPLRRGNLWNYWNYICKSVFKCASFQSTVFRRKFQGCFAVEISGTIGTTFAKVPSNALLFNLQSFAGNSKAASPWKSLELLELHMQKCLQMRFFSIYSPLQVIPGLLRRGSLWNYWKYIYKSALKRASFQSTSLCR